MELQHREITDAIIGAAFEVYGALDYGFLESVNKRAMQVELQARGFKRPESPWPAPSPHD
jgi:GxxExxY protein